MIKHLQFEQLMDVCGVDYLHYGEYEWETESNRHGFSVAVLSVKMHRALCYG